MVNKTAIGIVTCEIVPYETYRDKEVLKEDELIRVSSSTHKTSFDTGKHCFVDKALENIDSSRTRLTKPRENFVWKTVKCLYHSS